LGTGLMYWAQLQARPRPVPALFKIMFSRTMTNFCSF